MIGLWLILNSASALSLPEVEAALVEYTMAECQADSVSVGWLGLGGQLQGGDGADLRWSGSPCQSRPTLRLTVVEQGERVGSWQFRPALDIWITVPVASSDVVAGDLVPVESGLARVHEVRGETVGEGTWIAKVNLSKGEVLTTRVLRAQPDSPRGSRVRIEAKRGALTVAAEGRLMEDAFFGEEVRVLNLATRRSQKGRLVTLDTVQLN